MSDKQELIDLYAIYVQTITANEQRRQALSALYLSLVAAGIALFSSNKEVEYLAIVIPIAIVSLVWFATVRYFRNLAKAKFKVIDEFENNFEIKPFTSEWKYYKAGKGSKRIGLTHLELVIPMTLFLAAIAYIGYRISYPLFY